MTERNLGRKNNAFSSLDLRISKLIPWQERRFELIFEVFNLFNSSNFVAPQVTNLLFNFDGTIRSGGGNPRVAQLGARFVF